VVLDVGAGFSAISEGLVNTFVIYSIRNQTHLFAGQLLFSSKCVYNHKHDLHTSDSESAKSEDLRGPLGAISEPSVVHRIPF
jgi:hypothetical protein